MNAYDDQTLGAYVDGELDEAAREAFERALATDSDLVRRVEAQRKLRRALGAAFDPTLTETLPDRLLQTACGADRDTVVPIRASGKRPARWEAPHWWAVAASLLVGALLGRQVLGPRAADTTALGTGPDGVVASGLLAKALSQQLAADRGGSVQIGLTFRATSGEFCRTFEMRGANAAHAGLACREPDAWHVRIIEALTPEATPDGAMRQASSTELPESVRRAVESSIEGDALDAAAEVTARDAGWR
jgi:hypothetical protein